MHRNLKNQKYVFSIYYKFYFYFLPQMSLSYIKEFVEVPTGEMVRPVRLSATEWTAEVGKLRGMCETRGKV